MFQLYVDGGGTKVVPCYFSYNALGVKIVQMNRFLLRNLSPELLPLNCKTANKEGNESNNLAEYCALYYGLERFSKSIGKEPITIFQDSQLIVNQVNGSYTCRQDHLQPWLYAVKNIWWSSISLVWVPREEIVKVLGH